MTTRSFDAPIIVARLTSNQVILVFDLIEFTDKLGGVNGELLFFPLLILAAWVTICLK